jgi:uncharacterized protein
MQIAIIIRITETCNLHCRYCFVKPCTLNTHLSLEHFTALLKGLIDAGYRHIDLFWEGGEPLLVGMQLFRRITAIQQKIKTQHNISISNMLQTNATLITRKWIEFFRDQHFRVGISLDGDRITNDRNRRFSNGHSSFNRVINAIHQMQSEGLPVGILSVHTHENIRRISEYYAFIKSIGVQSFKVNPCFINKDLHQDLQVQPEEWGEAMIQLFDLWFNDNNPPWNGDFFGIIKSLFLGHSTFCMFNQTCLTGFLCLVPSGDMFPCSRLVNEHPEFHLGNIIDGLPTVLSNLRTLNRATKNIGCDDCKWLDICHGSCTAYAYWTHNTINSKDYLCSGYKRLFQHIYDAVQNIDLNKQLGGLK